VCVCVFVCVWECESSSVYVWYVCVFECELEFLFFWKIKAQVHDELIW
jgi:hypothetical protein